MNIWTKYKTIIRRNCTFAGVTDRQVIYWRNDLFATLIIYLLPLSVIALVPSLWWIVKTKQYVIGVVDIITIGCMLLIGFVPGLQISIRKIIFITCIYVFSFALLYYVGPKSSAMLYLLTACIFSVVIFSSNYLFWPAWINTFICALYGILHALYLLPQLPGGHIMLGEWVAISTNLIFLSFLCVATIPRLFSSLQTTINREVNWQQELTKEKKALDDTLLVLNQKNNELEQFAFIASHDLQEPLRMIGSFLTLLEKKYGDKLDDKAKQYIYFAVDGSKRMHRIILDLLDYSRVGRLAELPEKVDLNKIFAEVSNLFSKEIKLKGALLVADPLPVLQTHRSLVYQVFQNLIGNALKYSNTSEQPKIHISCRDLITHWEFSCSDNGIGIEQEYFDKIFIIFQRLHNRESYSGSGVGLAIIKKIIEFLGGKVWVNSTPGNGSVFYFTILKQGVNNT